MNSIRTEDTDAILRVLSSMAEELFRRGVSGEGIHLAVKRAGAPFGT
jgi:hypothetical protein